MTMGEADRSDRIRRGFAASDDEEQTMDGMWGIVLAAGRGRRVEAFIRRLSGRLCPKQFFAFTGRRTMLELYQFEECPYCQIVRTRLTDLGIDYLIRNEPRDKQKRERLQRISDQKGVPTLVDPERGVVIPDDDEKIIRYLEEQYQK
ncbi:MAG: glutathione S-transferase N-terminal domain-containing protein [Candidatus Manganitrophus sp. SA1]|nr:glutathione S-transferase N-terminal domain-containing protein [Candidatus Manganitrophus morganii]